MIIVSLLIVLRSVRMKEKTRRVYDYDRNILPCSCMIYHGHRLVLRVGWKILIDQAAIDVQVHALQRFLVDWSYKDKLTNRYRYWILGKIDNPRIDDLNPSVLCRRSPRSVNSLLANPELQMSTFPKGRFLRGCLPHHFPGRGRSRSQVSCVRRTKVFCLKFPVVINTHISLQFEIVFSFIVKLWSIDPGHFTDFHASCSRQFQSIVSMDTSTSRKINDRRRKKNNGFYLLYSFPPLNISHAHTCGPGNGSISRFKRHLNLMYGVYGHAKNISGHICS